MVLDTRNFEFDIVPESGEVGQRLDKVITDHLASLSRVKIQLLIKEGHVSVNGKPAKPSYHLEGGEAVSVHVTDNVLSPDWGVATPAQDMPLTILYEDQDMVAIDKPAGMVVHPGAGHRDGTLVNAILARWPEIAQVGGEGRAGIVHRLDKDTSGVILVARTEVARLYLMEQFELRQIKKRYLALVEGIPSTPTGEIDAPIGRDAGERKRMAVVRGGREAVTTYHVLKTYQPESSEGFSLLEAFPKTGRTHQIRVHMAFIGHPIVGDAVYGRRKVRLGLHRHFLHAETISLTTPSGKPLTVQAPLPPALQLVLDRLEQSSPS